VAWSRAAARRTESAAGRVAAATALSGQRRYDLD
jgi:4'-phosphopantetheinyl transferase EntD